MTSSRARTGANYDALSGWYDLLAEGSERRFRELGLEKLAVTAGEAVLEIGTGTGHALVALARTAGASGSACGIDLSWGMCRVTRSRLARAQLLPAAGLVCGAATSLPFRTGAFHAIFMSFALELFDETDMTVVLRQCARVLQPGGRMVVVSMAEPVRANIMTRMYMWAHRQFPHYVDCRPIPLADVLSSRGFRVNAVTRGSMWGLPVEIASARKPPE